MYTITTADNGTVISRHRTASKALSTIVHRLSLWAQENPRTGGVQPIYTEELRDHQGRLVDWVVDGDTVHILEDGQPLFSVPLR